jgi:hypothetical protein
MTTPLKNNYIGKFDEKLKIYDSIFFKSIDGSGGLLAEASKITEPNGLRIPTNKNATTYNTAQFSNFIRNIVNFNIKNFNMLDDRDNNMGFVSRTIGRNGTPAYIFNENVKTNIIETLKVVNVFVDILEAYKYCIDNKDKGASTDPFDTGFTVDTPIHRIEIVSGKTRFYDAAVTASSMIPASTVLNAGYIRSIKEYDGADKDITVLYLSIQSFNTGMVDAKYNYNNLFTKTKEAVAFDTTPANILNTAAKDGLTTAHPLATREYPRQVYSGVIHDPKAISNLTLENRNKQLITLLLKTLYNLDMNFRTQSVYALYYYYKFVQLYSGLVINVSNVMYADLTITSPLRIDTRNMTTSKAALGVSGIELASISGTYSSAPTFTQTAGGGTMTLTSPNITVGDSVSGKVNIANGGTGYTSTPTFSVSATPSTTAKATIVPIAIEYTSRTNEGNIDKLRDVMTEISDALSELITDISKYTANSNTSQVICTAYPDANPTTASFSTDNKVILNITKPCLISALNKRSEKDDFVNDFTVYDDNNKIYYSIIRINNEDTANFKIEINAVFTANDILEKDIDTKVFKKSDGSIIGKPATADAKASITTGNAEFLKISRKDINAYKTEYIYNRNDLEKLNENIGYNSSKVTHQTNQYQAQFNKNLFLERQILTYNIILAIIILVLLGINVANIDRQLVKTISLSCLGTIVLLFIIYFISNITYIETFVASTDALIVITAAHYGDKRNKLNPTSYNNQKLNTLKNEVDKLNAKFISYFEKIIITLPSTDNLDFYREIKDVITNDRDNKQFINKRLEYNKSQNSNDINSLKYELENNKLYINTLLISAIIFVGLYNLYINYATSDKYLSLLLFVSAIIFIIIVAYYLITSNRRVKTVFKNVYWGPEFSKRF